MPKKLAKKSAPKSRKPKVATAPTPMRNSTMPHEFRLEAQNMIRNGLSDAILGFDPQSMGTQITQLDTLFQNNRWYLISNMRQLLSEVYVEHGVIQTVVDVPVDDGLRGGIEIKSQQLDPEEIEKLQGEMEREDILSSVVGQAVKWNRLFGGGGILIMTDQDPETPLDVNAIGPDSPLEFRAVDLWELYWDKQNSEGYDATIQEQQFEFYNYYGKKIHRSRVMKMKGLTAPSFIRPRLRGWGFSIVESIISSLNQYLKQNNLAFEVLDEFKLDIFKLKNLTATLLNPNGEALVRQRVQLANQQKNYQNALTMDSEDEYIQKQLSFAGLAEIMKEIRIQIACDLRMPLTKIFGISASGFNSGEDDIENYNAMVESTVRSKCKYEIIRVLELKCQQLFGSVPDDLTIAFKPLRVLGAEAEENVKTQKFNRLLAAKQANEITTEEFRDAVNRDNLLSIQLDTSDAVLTELDEQSEPPVEEPADEGANREDSQKSEVPKREEKAK